MNLEIECRTIRRGYDRKTCWVHTRPGAIPGNPPVVVVTMQKLRLTGSDVFYALSDMRSDDGGETWTGPVEHSDTLGRRPNEEGGEVGVSDFWPMWHEKSGVLLGTGHTVHYRDDTIPSRPLTRSTVYSAYDPIGRTWSPWRRLETPYPRRFVNEGAGSTQRVDLPSGDILLPTYFTLPETFVPGPDGCQMSQCVSTVLRCTFDGATLRCVEHGDELTVATGRGYSEPSLAAFRGRFFLTIRNDDYGVVCRGRDGLHFDTPHRWTFDDGSDLGSYNTQQHWVTMPDALYLVYTRRGANNDHVVRHRAPLFIAQVDPDRLCAIRATERVIVPERGAGLGNFGVVRIGDAESWVTTSEWMQTKPPRWWDVAACEKHGSDNSVYLVKVRSVR